MSVPRIRSELTKRDLLVFAGLWAVFLLLLARMAVAAAAGRGGGLIIGAAATGACLVVSLALNREVPMRAQLKGVLIPLLLLFTWGAGRWAQAAGLSPELQLRALLAGFGGAAVVGALAIAAVPGAGRAVYRVWMAAALPIGWTISQAILTAVFYLVVTPVGLLLRAAGKDPLRRSFDRSAATYWLPHQQVTEARRYFRQF